MINFDFLKKDKKTDNAAAKKNGTTKPKKQYCSVKSEKRKEKKAFPVAVGISLIVSTVILITLALI